GRLSRRPLNLSAMRGEQCLIRRYNVFSTSNRRKNQMLRRLIAADQFGHDINVWVLKNHRGVSSEQSRWYIDPTITFEITDSDSCYLDRHTDTMPNQFCVFF